MSNSHPGLAGTKKGDGTFTAAALFNEGGIAQPLAMSFQLRCVRCEHDLLKNLSEANTLLANC